MERGIIKIEDRNISITNKNVWMTQAEIADLFYARAGMVSFAIRSIFKSNAFKHYDVCRQTRWYNGCYADLYNLDMIIAISYHIDTFKAALFRQWIQGKIFEKKTTVVLLLKNTKKQKHY